MCCALCYTATGNIQYICLRLCFPYDLTHSNYLHLDIMYSQIRSNGSIHMSVIIRELAGWCKWKQLNSCTHVAIKSKCKNLVCYLNQTFDYTQWRQTYRGWSSPDDASLYVLTKSFHIKLHMLPEPRFPLNFKSALSPTSWCCPTTQTTSGNIFQWFHEANSNKP